jgi:hypothetical protein
MVADTSNNNKVNQNSVATLGDTFTNKDQTNLRNFSNKKQSHHSSAENHASVANSSQAQNRANALQAQAAA